MSPLQAALESLVAPFAARGWVLRHRPTTVLAMTQHPAAGVEHRLFIHEPWSGPSPAAGAAARPLAVAVNVHYPLLEDCINQALDRGADEAGRQSLRLLLARLAPPRADDATARGAGADEGWAERLLSDFDVFLEPVRQRLCTPSALEHDPLPPTGVDPWTWHLRRAAHLHLQGDEAAARGFLLWLRAQAEQFLDEAPSLAPGLPTDPGRTRARREAEDALRLTDALLRPRRRLIRMVAAA
jgi:hypothetical protein